MRAITIRGIDEEMAKRLKRRAQKEGLSVNALLLGTIKRALGLEKNRRDVEYDDLDSLAGTWSEEEYRDFQERTSGFETIDEAMWKHDPDHGSKQGR